MDNVFDYVNYIWLLQFEEIVTIFRPNPMFPMKYEVYLNISFVVKVFVLVCFWITYIYYYKVIRYYNISAV